MKAIQKEYQTLNDGDDGFNRPIISLYRLSRGITADDNGYFIVWFVYIHFEQIMHLKDMKECVIIMTITM